MNRIGAMFLALLTTSVLVGVPAAWGAESSSKVTVHRVLLDAKMLYGGFEARKVLFDAEKGVIKLDPNALKYAGDKFGTIVTDPIDLAPADEASPYLGSAARVREVNIKVNCEMPEGSKVSLEGCTSSRFFQRVTATDWKEARDLKIGYFVGMGLYKTPTTRGPLEAYLGHAKGRYLRLRLLLEAKDVEHLPTGTSVTVRSVLEPAPPWKGKLRLLRFDNQEVVTSPIEFGYELPDQPDIARFREQYNIDEIIEGANTDFERAWLLTKWVGSKLILRERFDTGYYPWDINKILVDTPEGLRIKGHCMSYAIVLTTALTSINIPARHWCERGFRDCSHEVVEAWIQELGKWVYFDPSLSTYYRDVKTKMPLSILEMHNTWLDTFLKAGEDLNHPGHTSGELKKRVRGRDHNEIIGHVREGKPYGGEPGRIVRWDWAHGYLTTGWLQLTPRNNFHGQRDPLFKRFAHNPYGWDGFPYWVAAKTPLVGRHVSNWFTRERDLYWTLNQASMRLAKTEKQGVLEVDLGHSLPFFEKFVVTVDGKEVPGVGGCYSWQLKPGKNTLRVLPLDRYGRKGKASFVALEYLP